MALAALTALAPRLPEALLPEALKIVREVRHEGQRAAILVELAPRLPEALLLEALPLAQALRDRGERARAIAALAPHCVQRAGHDAWPLLVEVLTDLATVTRSDFLGSLPPLLPLLEQQGFAQALAEVARAICDVGRWWP